MSDGVLREYRSLVDRAIAEVRLFPFADIHEAAVFLDWCAFDARLSENTQERVKVTLDDVSRARWSKVESLLTEWAKDKYGMEYCVVLDSSENGDDDWIKPVYASIELASGEDTEEFLDNYGLGDLFSGSAEEQAKHLWSCLLEG